MAKRLATLALTIILAISGAGALPRITTNTAKSRTTTSATVKMARN
jgi:hypothetical protein